MDWKAKVVVVVGPVSGALISAIGIFPSDVVALFDSLFPNAGYYVVRVVFWTFVVCLAGALIYSAYHLLFKGLFGRLHAEIVGKQQFRLGETVPLSAWFQGKLKDGLFTCRIVAPKGTVLPDTKKGEVWWPSYKPLHQTKADGVGILCGWKKYESAWEHDIPLNYPLGTYGAFIGVYERADWGNKPVREMQTSFSVVEPFSGSNGTSNTITRFVPVERITDEPRSV